MWRNADVLDFVGWLRAHNERLRPGERKVGFYGLDLYSLHASMTRWCSYLGKVDPGAARRARQRYACFDHVSGGDPQAYGYAAELGIAKSCEDEAVRQLVELRRSARGVRAAGRPRRPRRLLLRGAERAAREERRGVLPLDVPRREPCPGISATGTWSRRSRPSRHSSTGTAAAPKVVVWAHNSHLGDARATEMGSAGEWNVGQLVRERHGDEALLVGFTTHAGTVTAASDWDAPAERKRVREALPGSYEALFHEVGLARFYLPLGKENRVAELRKPRLERAIGVVYLPETERASHYFHACLPDQFDAVLHIDRTRAVEPLERTAEWERGEVPETFPTGV